MRRASPAYTSSARTTLTMNNYPVGLSQPTVSHHLKMLVDAGILTREQRGRWAYYRLVPDDLTASAELIAPSSPPRHQ